ncbi:MAG: hypothetical protein H7Z19_22355, partial [Chitinophagaceae bacterium]|nr:hypothetical protein [Rubrivivax sp.]
MSYRSLLVFLDQDALCVARTQVAFQRAKVFDCHLVGVAPTGLVDLPAMPAAASSLVVFHSARPTLTLPRMRRFVTVGTNVMVAWDDSREAA